MRNVAAIPAVGLLAGVAAGCYFPSAPLGGLRAIVLASLAVAGIAWRHKSPRALVALVAWTFCLGGAALGASAWDRAWRPPLLAAYDALGGARADSALAVLTGRLRADAAPTASGVSLSLDVLSVSAANERAAFGGPSGKPLGGAIVTVVGELGPERMGEWRAGRVVRAPAELRRASVYLDPGVPDHERELAARGTRLVGTVKSAALVEVLAHGTPVQEWLAVGAGVLPPRHRRRRRPVQRALGRDRRRDRDRRSHGAGR